MIVMSRRLSDDVPVYTAILSVILMGGMFFLVLFLLSKVMTAIYGHYMRKRIAKALLARRDTGDSFREENGYSWDYVMQFRIFDEDEEINYAQRTYNVKRILAQLSSGGLEFRLFYNRMHNSIFCKIRASPHRLMKEADRTGMKLEFDEDALEEVCRAGRKRFGWGPIETPETSLYTSIPPFRYIYGVYRMNPEMSGTRQDLVRVYKRRKSILLAPTGSNINQIGDAHVPMMKDGIEMQNVESTEDSTVRTPMQTRISSSDDDSPLAADGIATSAQPNSSGMHSMNEDNGLGADMQAVSDGTVSHKIIEVNPEGFQDTVKVEYQSIFRGVDRLKLIHSIINNHSIGGCYLNTKSLLRDGAIQDYTPLHDEVKLRELESKWILLLQLPWNQKISDIKDYFGGRIGLYFTWLGHYTSWLVIAMAMGIIAWANVQANASDPNAVIMPYFAGAMALWATLYLESWKRNQITMEMKWGTSGVEETQGSRPDFHGLKTIDPVTGESTLYYARHLRTDKLMKSGVAMTMAIGVVVGCLAVIFVIRAAIASNPGIASYADVISSCLTAIQIELLNHYFNGMAVRLNDAENYRTDVEYEDALITKAFVFQFLNSFGSLFYVAFIKPFYAGDVCNPATCFTELQNSLGALFMSRLFLANFIKLVVPSVQMRLKLQEAKSIDEDVIDARHDLSEVERTFMMPEYDPLMSTFDDYSAIVSQFGYMTMFVSAFPLCTVLSFINNYVQLRVDAWRLTQISRRPIPHAVQDIGMWFTVLELTGIMSVFTNSGLVSFTGTFAMGQTWVMRSWIFVMMSLFILGVKWFYAYIIPDTPVDVGIQLEREEFINSKIIDNKQDVNDDLNVSLLRVRPDFHVRSEDEDPM